MMLDPYLSWLGFRTPATAIGLHITSEFMTLVAARHRPVRLVTVARQSIPDDAVVGNEIRLIKPLVAGLQGLVNGSRLQLDTPIIAAVEPLANSLTIWDDGPQVLNYSVAESTYSRIGEVVDRAGLELSRVDIVPAALARLGRQLGVSMVAGRWPTGWSVVADQGFIDAERSTHGTPSMPPLADLPGIHIPARLRRVVDPGRDSAAIGAALAGFGCPPLVSTQPAAEAAGPDWTVQHVRTISPLPRTETGHRTNT